MHDSTDRSAHSGHGLLAELAASHLTVLQDRIAEDDRTLPPFVVRELEAMSRCGDFTHGFLRLRCTEISPLGCQIQLRGRSTAISGHAEFVVEACTGPFPPNSTAK